LLRPWGISSPETKVFENLLPADPIAVHLGELQGRRFAALAHYFKLCHASPIIDKQVETVSGALAPGTRR
jgi:hypothetical protein